MPSPPGGSTCRHIPTPLSICPVGRAPSTHVQRTRTSGRASGPCRPPTTRISTPSPRGEGVEILVVGGLHGPEARPLVLVRCTCVDGARPTGQIDNGVGMCLQVEPPGGLGIGPAVHGHGDQVRTVLEVTEDGHSLLTAAA